VGHASPATTVSSPGVSVRQGLPSADPWWGELAEAGGGGDGRESSTVPVEAAASIEGGVVAGKAVANDRQASAKFPMSFDKVGENTPLGRRSPDE